MVKKENSSIRRNQEKKEREGTKQLFSYKVFGDNLKKAREGHYSQKDLAEEAKKYGDVSLSESTIKACEQGKANISAQALYVLSDIFEKSMDELVSRNFKVEDKKNDIGAKTGLTDKSVKFLKEKRKEKDRKKKTVSRVKVINNVTFHLNELDAVNYLIENSDIFSLFIDKAKLTYVELLELNKAENEVTAELRKMYVDLCKEKDDKNLEDEKLKQIYHKLQDIENSEILDIKQLELLYKALNKSNKSIEYINTSNKLKKKKQQLGNIKNRKKYIVNFASFCIYDSINSAFKKYINLLSKENNK